MAIYVVGKTSMWLFMKQGRHLCSYLCSREDIYVAIYVAGKTSMYLFM